MVDGQIGSRRVRENCRVGLETPVPVSPIARSLHLGSWLRSLPYSTPLQIDRLPELSVSFCTVQIFFQREREWETVYKRNKRSPPLVEVNCLYFDLWLFAGNIRRQTLSKSAPFFWVSFTKVFSLSKVSFFGILLATIFVCPCELVSVGIRTNPVYGKNNKCHGKWIL